MFLSLAGSHKFMQRQFCHYIVFLMALSILSSEVESKSTKYIPWSGPCKIGENLKPNEKCDKAKGMSCLHVGYPETEGYCLCSLEDSYDHKSKECRLKVGQYCTYVNATADPEEFERLPVQEKCHEDAECTKETKEAELGICICKKGFIASSDKAECNFSTSTTANNVLCGLALLIIFPLNILRILI